MRAGSQTTEELRHLARQVAQTWQQLVTLGVSHNDFKLENFIVDDDLRVWLIDLERMRIGGNADRQRERQVFDVKNFLHVRGWHHRAEARAIFAEAFLQTPCGKWLRSTGVDRVALGSGLSATECDAELSALILCNGGIDLRLARKAIESVQDIADEVVLAEPTRDGRLKVLKHVEPFPSVGSSATDAKTPAAKLTAAEIARHPWVLVLHQNECVTPFLAKELQQRIADTRAGAAFRIPLERQYFGRTVRETKTEQPIRLFRSSDCGFSVDGGALRVEAATDRTDQLIGTIQSCECATVAEFVERLNEESSRAASVRLQAGERPRLVRALCARRGSALGNVSGARAFVAGGPACSSRRFAAPSPGLKRRNSISWSANFAKRARRKCLPTRRRRKQSTSAKAPRHRGQRPRKQFAARAAVAATSRRVSICLRLNAAISVRRPFLGRFRRCVFATFTGRLRDVL